MANIKLVRCTCCDAELTAPQYHNGKPYGYTCITKLTGTKGKSENKEAIFSVVKESSETKGKSNRKILMVTDGNVNAWIVYFAKESDAKDSNGEMIVPSEIILSLGTAKKKSPCAVAMEKVGMELSMIWKKRV